MAWRMVDDSPTGSVVRCSSCSIVGVGMVDDSIVGVDGCSNIVVPLRVPLRVPFHLSLVAETLADEPKPVAGIRDEPRPVRA